MSETTTIDVPQRSSPLASLCRRLVLSRLEGLTAGRLLVEEAGRRWCLGEGGPLVRVRVEDPDTWIQAVFGGSVGVCEAYVAGRWSCSDLVGLVRLLLRNRPVLERIEGGLARLSQPLRKAAHLLNRNTRTGSRRNIAAHYDLGNDFYRLWLDQTLSYSCALFERRGMTLAEASTAKLERVCRKLELTPADHLLEIGTGWGGLALHAAGRFGCRVTTVTLSREQQELAAQRVAEAGLSDHVRVLLSDYREVRGRFDKLVSIEMVEAVGADHLRRYFADCSRLLRPHGVMLLQAITIDDRRYEEALRGVDFIQKHIFPGGFLPSVTALAAAVTRASDLRILHLEDMGPHYAETLARWRDNFFRNLEGVRALGFSEEFLRKWELYLCYCEGGFRERDLGTVQMLLAKPGWRGRLPVGDWNVSGTPLLPAG